MLPQTRTDVQHRVDYLNTPMRDTRPILLSTSAAWMNKQTVKALQNPHASPAQIEKWKKANWNAFAPQHLTLDALVSHILAGRAWMPAAAKARNHFQSAQALALDFDNDDAGSLPVSIEALKLHPVIAQYAAFVYATPSSTPARPKSRVLFILDEAINTAEGYRAAAAALMDLCADLHPDAACKDAARLFFGSHEAAHWTNAAAVLPLALLREHALNLRRAERHTRAAAASLTTHLQSASAADAPRAEKRKRAYAVNALNNNVSQLASTPKGGGKFGGRNGAFHALLCETLNLAYTLPGTLNEVEIIDMMSRAAATSGLPQSEITSVVQSALRYPRETLRSIRVDFSDDARPRKPGPMNMQRRPVEKVARTDFSPKGELPYAPLDEDMPAAFYEGLGDIEDMAFIDVCPTLADEDAPPPIDDYAPMDTPPYTWADARTDEHGKDSVKARQFDGESVQDAQGDKPAPRAHMLQYASTLEYPHALPDALIDEGLRLYGKSATSELNYLLSAQARGILPKAFTLADASEARQHDGLTTSVSLRNVYKAMTDYGLLHKGTSDDLCTDLSYSLDRHADAPSMHDKTMQNSRRGRKQALYSVMPLSEIRKRMARPAAAALMAMHPESMPVIDDAHRGRVKRVLEGLQRRKSGIRTLSAGLVRPYLSDEDKPHAEAIFEAIKAIPITDESLLVEMGLTAHEAAAVSGLLFNEDMAALIEMKNRIVARLYAERLAALDDPHITALTEDTPRLGDAWLNALRHARAMPHNQAFMSAFEMARLMGVDNVRTAYRQARKAGIHRHERVERRTLDVKRIGDTTPSTEAVQQAIKDACNTGEKSWARRVFSYDEHGEVMDIQDYKDVEDLRIGVRFEVEVQLKSQITVDAAAPVLAERLKADASEDAAPDAQADALVGDDASRTHRRERQTRLSPECLHSRQWLLARLLAPVCFDEALGVWWNPQTGELHASAQDVLNDVMGVVPDEAQAAEGVIAS